MYIPILPETVAPAADSTETSTSITADGAAKSLNFAEIFAKLLDMFQSLEPSSEEVETLPGGASIATLEEEVVDGEVVFVPPEEGLESAETSVEETTIDIDIGSPEVEIEPVAVSPPGKEVSAAAKALHEAKESASVALTKAVEGQPNADATSAKSHSEKGEVVAATAKSAEQPAKPSAESLPARVAFAKLTELTAEFSARAETDSASAEQQPKDSAPGSKIAELGTSMNGGKPVTEAIPMAEQMASEVAKTAGPKVDAPLLSVAPASVETAAASEVKAPPELPRFEAPTIRTVGDFTIRSVRHLLGSQEESIQIRLVPRSLGELHIAVKTHGNGVEVVVSAANGLVRDVLESQLPGLKDALSKEGVEVTRVSVHNGSMSDTGNPLSQSQAHIAQRQQSSGASFSDGGFVDGEDELVESEHSTSRAAASTHDGDLDLMA